MIKFCPYTLKFKKLKTNRDFFCVCVIITHRIYENVNTLLEKTRPKNEFKKWKKSNGAQFALFLTRCFNI
jgi:hypothetical protein